MKAGTQVSLEEYLETSYRPDCDYVDGEVVERNVGEYEHGDFQTAIGAYLRARRARWGIHVVTEVRIRVTPSRYRIPDILVTKGARPTERYLTQPPFLCVEILSDRDTLHSVQERIDDYLAMGVPYVWVVNPHTVRGWVYTKDAIVEAKDGVLRTKDPDIELPLRQAVKGD
jgi:Uma2 family endonuclease